MRALAELHPAMLSLAPGLAELDWSSESRADCNACPMLEENGEHPAHAFVPEGRCCTYHPSLASFLAGRALATGGAGAGAVLSRLSDRTGVGPLGIEASATWQRHFDAAGEAGFGFDVGLRCPYWAGGELACALWGDRPGLCRTWFCKHDGGVGGALQWNELRKLLTDVERIIARLCAAGVESPAEDAEVEVWARWYRGCHERAEDVAAAAAASGDEGAKRVAESLVALGRRPSAPPMPAVLVASVRGQPVSHRGRLRIVGYSEYDAATAPAHVFEFIAGLDGRRPWREAALMASPPVSQAVVEELFRVGAIEAPSGPTLGDRLRALPIDD